MIPIRQHIKLAKFQNSNPRIYALNSVREHYNGNEGINTRNQRLYLLRMLRAITKDFIKTRSRINILNVPRTA